MPYVDAARRREQFVAAARTALAARGVANTSVRDVAAEAGVPLATMQYVFPSKDQLLRAVIEDVVEEIAQVLAGAAATEHGLAHAVREGLTTFWHQLVEGGRELQLLQYEFVVYSLRTPGQADLARLQYERYAAVVEHWCREAAEHAGETVAVPYEHLARTIVAGVDGLILQYVSDPDDHRAQEGLVALAAMVTALALPGSTGQAERKQPCR